MTQSNFFKFCISYKNKTISESIFDADCYNQQTRQSVNIKNLVPDIRRSLQRVLSTPTQKLTNNFYVGVDHNNDKKTIMINDTLNKNISFRWKYLSRPHESNSTFIKGSDLNEKNLTAEYICMTQNQSFYIVMKDGSSKPLQKNAIKILQTGIVDTKEQKEYNFNQIKQLEIVVEYQFKFSLFLNNNYIIEREFTVYNYNPESILSKEFIDVTSLIVREIKEFIYKSDINQIYDDGYLMENHGLTIPQIRALTPEERKHLLKTSYHMDFVDEYDDKTIN